MQTMEEGSFNRNDLFKKAMNKDWVSVIEAYKNNRSVRRAKLTRTEHTILHLAVLHKDDNVVEQLVNAIEDDEASEILKLKSNLGDTPLHVAAALGLTKTCVLLAKKWAMLVVIVRNNVGETPLYVAVHHGKKDAFFVLQDYIPTSLMSDDLSFCRRADDNTILHAAIHGIYFDLAIEIIKLYPRLVNFNNDMGQSPLHLLANKPLVFKSGNPPPDIVKKHLHSCIIVDRLVPKYHLNEWRNEPEIKRPHNYARFGIKLALTKTFRILLPEVFWLAERFTMRRQSSMDNNQDGLHATLSEDQERDEEYGRPVRSAKPRFKILMDHQITTVVANFISLRIMGIVWIVGIVGIVVIRYLMVPRLMRIPRFEFLMDFPITIVVANFISLRIMGIVWIVRIMGNVVIKFLKDRRWKETMKREKTMHEHANQVMEELINLSSYWEYHESGKMRNTPYEKSSTSSSEILEGEIMQIKGQQKEKDKEADKPITDSPILLAAKRGIVEMVKNILDTFPVAIEDFDSNHKNIILLSAEHRQLKVYEHMLERRPRLDNAFAMVDKDGNNALHLAAGAIRDNNLVGPAFQLQQEIKWFKFVRNSKEPSFFQDCNNKGQTAKEIFSEKHESLIREGREWLRNTSQSCSVIASLIVTVAFTFPKTIPGGVDPNSGFPTLRGKHAFSVFAQSTTVALFLSIISTLMFLTSLTTHYQVSHFERYIPGMMLIGLITLFASIVTMLISFIASYILVMEDYKSLPVFVCSCIPVIISMFQLPVYRNMMTAISDAPEFDVLEFFL